MRDGRKIGILALLTFQVGTALRDTYIQGAYGPLNFFELAFIAFLTASLCFSASLLLRAPEQLPLLARSWRLVVAVNVTTAVAWLCYFGALARVEPSVANTIFSGISPLAVSALALLGVRAGVGARATPIEHAVHIALAITLVALTWVVLSGRSGLGDLPVRVATTGLLLAFVSGVVITVETIYSKRLNEAGVAAAGVLGVRFLLVTLIAGVITLGSGQAHLLALPASLVARTSAFSLLLIAAPLFFVQFGLSKTSPMTTSALLSLNPAFVLCAQALSGRIPTSRPIVALTLVYSALALAASFLRRADEDAAPSPITPAA